MKHAPTPWGLKNAYPGTSLQYYQIFDADGDGVLGQDSVTMDEFSILESTAKRIVECVNAMEGIEDPIAFREQYNKSKRGKLILTQEELQKLGEQYRNQEETPYVETSQPTGRITQVAFGDTLQEAEQTIFYMKKYDQLKKVIQNMVARLDEGGEMTLTKDSIIVFALKGAIE